MLTLPPPQTPLNQHSLLSLESWLGQLGAIKSDEDPSLWHWQSTQWNLEMKLDRDELCVVWYIESDSSQRQRCFSYGLSREDVEAAINEGP